MAEHDQIVPIESAEPLAGLVRSAVRDELRLATGHVRVVAGRQATTRTIPQIVDWISEYGSTASAALSRAA